MFNLDKKTGKESNILDVNVKNYPECGFCEDKQDTETLDIPWSIWSQWLYISQRIGNKEWGAVFWVKDNAITNFKIPRQEVSSVDCEFKEELGGDGIVHSHHEMGAFHSTQDDRHARNLYCYSIVLSSSRGYEATKRVKLPCEGFGYVKVSLRLVEFPEIDFSRITERVSAPLAEISQEQQLGFEQQDSPCDSCSTHNCENCKFLGANNLPCENCESFKCKECNLTKGMDISEVLPFCDFCEDYGYCPSCERLFKYLQNYPQDKKLFEHLVTNNS